MTKKVLFFVPWALFCAFTPAIGMQKDLTPYLAFNNKKLTPIACDGSLDVHNTITLEGHTALGGTLYIHPSSRCAISFTNNGNSIKMEIPLSEKQIDHIITKYSRTQEHEENIFYCIDNQLIRMKIINDYRPKPATSAHKTSQKKASSFEHRQIFSIAASSFIILAVLSYLLYE